MLITPEEMARRALEWGDERPFDADSAWQDEFLKFDGTDQPTPTPPHAEDWAHRAARGIVAELQDGYGGALETAFSRELVGEDGRKSIVDTMAAIIRQAWRERPDGNN